MENRMRNYIIIIFNQIQFRMDVYDRIYDVDNTFDGMKGI